MKRLILLVMLIACAKEESVNTSQAPSLRTTSPRGEQYEGPVLNIWYNNTFDDSLQVSLAAATRDIDWMDANRIHGARQAATLYISSPLLRTPAFPQALSYASSKGIDIGIAYRLTSQIDDILSYNQGRPDNERIKYVITELEPWNTGDYAGMTAKMQYAKPRMQAQGMKHLVYIGWPDSSYYPTIITYADEINLHCYRMSKDMNVNGIWGYLRGRLSLIAAEAQAQNKVMPVNIIYSCEPAFAQSWFAKHAWDDAQFAFLSAFEQNATPQMKQWIRVKNLSIFVTRYAHPIRP